jgi:ABC-type branched-subunit amino acid transport system substrate-binding protein
MLSSRIGPRQSFANVVQLALLTFCCITSVAATALAQPATDKVKIAVLGEMTGAAATSGANAAFAAKLAIRDVNAAGGILGRQLELVIADNQTDPTIAVGEAKRLAFQEHVDLVLGPNLTALFAAVAPVFTEAKIPSIASISQLPPMEINRYGFTVVPSGATQAQGMVNYAADVAKYKQVAILVDDTANSKIMQQVMKTSLTERNIGLTGVQEFEFHAKDVTPQLLSLRRGSPEAVLLNGSAAPDIALVLKSFDEVNWDVPVVGSIALGGLAQAISKIGGPETFKHAVAQDYKTFTYCSGDPLGQSPVGKFLAKVRESDPKQYPELNTFTIAALYDAVQIYKAAVESNKSFDGVKVAAWIEANVGTVDTLVGKMEATPTNHSMAPASNMVMIERPDHPREDGLRHRAGC